MGPSDRFTHAMDYIGYGIYVVNIIAGPKRSFLLSIVVYETLCGHDIDVWDRLNKFCILVELPVQRRLCRFSKVASGNPTPTCIPWVDG